MAFKNFSMAVPVAFPRVFLTLKRTAKGLPAFPTDDPRSSTKGTHSPMEEGAPILTVGTTGERGACTVTDWGATDCHAQSTALAREHLAVIGEPLTTEMAESTDKEREAFCRTALDMPA